MAFVVYYDRFYLPSQLLFVIVLWGHNSQGTICVHNQSREMK